MERLDKNNYAALMAMAIVNELESNRGGAKEYTRRAELNHSKNNFDFKFNYGSCLAN